MVSGRVHRLSTSQQRLARTHSFVCGHEDSTAADGGQPRSEAVLDQDGTESAGSFACIHGRHVCDAAVVERTGSKHDGRRDCSVPIWRRYRRPATGEYAAVLTPCSSSLMTNVLQWRLRSQWIMRC